MDLTAENVRNTLMACLFDHEPSEEEMKNAVKVEGVLLHIAFDKARLETQKENIRALLAELPAAFGERHGGGWSFLNACMTKNGVQWGEHRDIDALLCLGLAAGYVELCLPRDMWDVFPSGVPYFVVKIPQEG